MVWIFVDHDGVAVPVPVVDVVIVVGRNAEVKIVEPEAVAIATSKAVFMTAPKAAGETTVFPGVVEVIALVAPPGIVTNPGIVMMNVRRLGMIGMIAERMTIVLRTTLWGATFVCTIFGRMLIASFRCAILRGPGGSAGRGRRTVRGNMAAAYVARAAAALSDRLCLTALLAKSGGCESEK
jgi:hypothetical protein